MDFQTIHSEIDQPFRPLWTRSGNRKQSFKKQIAPTNQERETRYWGARFIPPSKITDIAIACPVRLMVSSFAKWGMRLPKVLSALKSLDIRQKGTGPQDYQESGQFVIQTRHD